MQVPFQFIRFIISICFINYSSSKNYSSKNDLESKIIGGKPVDVINIPYAAQFYNSDNLCGAVILNTWSLMTAAHCFDHNEDTDKMMVSVGATYIYDFKAKSYLVRYFVRHDKYNAFVEFSCDIGLLFVTEPIRFGDKVKKAVLVPHNRWMTESETNFTVAGWGITTYRGFVSTELLMTTLRFIPKKQCERYHNVTFSNDIFCLYGEGKTDTCRGDSGGGVYWKGFVVGLTSHGDGCSKKGKPSMYANLWYLKGWIEIQMNDFIREHCNGETII